MTEASAADSLIIKQTKTWLESVVIGLDFCPFAQRELERDSIHYSVIPASNIQNCLESLILECELLDRDQNIATSLLIFPGQFTEFDDFLDYQAMANALLEAQNYQGIYQLASFHPEYCFDGATNNDPANYTNRSPYPMLHLLREDKLEIALKHYPHPEQIPEKNIQCANKLGETTLKAMLESCRVKSH
jgi:hypothetical protein